MFKNEKELFNAIMAAKKAEFEATHTRAYSLADKAIDAGVALVIIALLIGTVGASIFFATNTSGWDSTSKLIWPYIFVIIIVGALLGALYMFRKNE